jgi:uncharacterized protein (DUF1778 family)
MSTPPRAEAARTRYSVRLSPVEHQRLAEAAALHRMRLGEFVREVATSAAADVLDERDPEPRK